MAWFTYAYTLGLKSSLIRSHLVYCVHIIISQRLLFPLLQIAVQRLDASESSQASIDSLLKSQEKVAKLIEISFYIIADFPELSRGVR